MTEAVERLQKSLADRYRIDREIGQGGMAVVYLADDLRHQRRVALKVLRPEVSAILGPERFLHEIHVIAQLHHPHVLPLFDSRSADGLLFYVMPYVEGESLRQRLARERQLSIEQSIQLTTQIASALDYAHRQGVIHRDIKPENILLADGQALVADFGVALAVSTLAGDRFTKTGLSLGTPQYMSPEQAAAERYVDGRSDIYSLGCVLYEMLAGAPPHEGAAPAVVLARLMLSDRPRPITELRDTVPQSVAAALHKALAKLPADRFANAADFGAALTRTGDSHLIVAPALTPGVTPRPRGGKVLRVVRSGWVVAAIFAIATVATGLQLISERPGMGEPVHFTIPVAARQGGWPYFALSPRGGALVYRGPDGALLLRHLNAPAAIPIPGTEGAVFPSFSPNGEWLAYSQSRQIKKILLTGGPAVPIAMINVSHGIAWSEDGSMYLGDPSGNPHLRRVSDQGGSIALTTTAVDTDTAIGSTWPQALAGGNALMFTTLGLSKSARDSRIILQNLRTGARRIVQEHATHGRYVRNGRSEYILYAVASGTVMAAPFNLRRQQVTGSAFPVLSDVQAASNGGVLFAVSEEGTLAFVRGSSTNLNLFKWVDRTGREVGQLGGPSTGDLPTLSPDGEQAAGAVGSPESPDIWLRETASGRSERFTLDLPEEEYPVWSPDGRWIAYSWTGIAGASRIYIKPVGSTSDPKLAYSGTTHLHPTSWSPDGQWLALNDLAPGTNWNLRVLRIDGKESRLVSATPALEQGGVFSPDGRWLTFHSAETGRNEVYVVSFPALSGKKQVSTGGGLGSKWARDGSALFYKQGRRLIRVPVSHTPTLSFGTPQLLFEADFREFEVAPDGNRFLLLVDNPDAQRAEIHVIVNWFSELERLRKAARK